MPTNVYTNSTSVTVPSYWGSLITLLCQAPGGGGGGANTGAGGDGGGGGAIANKSLTVSPGDVLDITVDSPGTGGAGAFPVANSGTDGGDASVVRSSATCGTLERWSRTRTPVPRRLRWHWRGA